MTAASLQETLKELNELCRLFADAESALKQGKMIDMTGVDARVAAVCETVQKAVPDQQKEYLPEMTVLINLLNIYEKSLREAWEGFAAQQDQTHANS